MLGIVVAPVGATAKPFNMPLVPSSELEPAPWSAALTAKAKSINRRFKDGEIVAYVSDPYRGFQWGYRDDQPYYLASGVKLTFMIEVFRQREQGKLSFDDTVTYGNANIRDGAPRVNKQRNGAKIKISTLLDWMMRSSDNAASDMLAGHVGLENVNPGLVEEGLSGFSPLTYLIDVRRGIYRELDVTADDLSPIQVRKIRWTRIWNPQIRKIEQLLGKPKYTFKQADLMQAYQRYFDTGVNRAPMRSVGLLFEKMAHGELVSETASEEMLTLMSAARTSTHRLLGKMPRGTTVAHKTGSQFKKVCDLGIIFLPDKTPLIVTACTNGGAVPAAENAIATIARSAYDLAVSEHRAYAKAGQ